MKMLVPSSARIEEFAKGPGARHGRSNSLKWPWLYDKLRAKGYDKSKAAAISNSRLGTRKKGRISVLTAKQAHSPKVLGRLAKADKKGKHSTKGSLTAAAAAYVATFACHDPSCAPPPAGRGGSLPDRRHAPRGVISDRRETPQQRFGRLVEHVRTTQERALANVRAERAKGVPVITAAQARGDSRPVSHDEFQRLAREGQKQLDGFKSNGSPHTGLDQHWDQIKTDSFNEVQKPWGGATINSHTGQALPQGANKFAITVKDVGAKTISVPENATRTEFDSAMDLAKSRFSHVLQRQDHHLGVFRDNDNNRIDIDPVLVVSKRSDVDTIGAATHAIGGAYNFKDGNGYWPPHVSEGTVGT